MAKLPYGVKLINCTDVLYGFSILLKATFVKFYDCFIEERNAKRLNYIRPFCLMCRFVFIVDFDFT